MKRLIVAAALLLAMIACNGPTFVTRHERDTSLVKSGPIKAYLFYYQDGTCNAHLSVEGDTGFYALSNLPSDLCARANLK